MNVEVIIALTVTKYKVNITPDWLVSLKSHNNRNSSVIADMKLYITNTFHNLLVNNY